LTGVTTWRTLQPLQTNLNSILLSITSILHYKFVTSLYQLFKYATN
jgi:hypothetical protein